MEYENYDQKTIRLNQRAALNAWHKAGYCGSIIAGTGFGKSRCGVLAVAHALENGGSCTRTYSTASRTIAEEFRSGDTQPSDQGRDSMLCIGTQAERQSL